MSLLQSSLYEKPYICSGCHVQILMVWISPGWVRGRGYTISTGTHKHTLSPLSPSAGNVPATSVQERSRERREVQKTGKWRSFTFNYGV